jgi:hypothetical protein
MTGRRDAHPVEFGCPGDRPLVVVAGLAGQEPAHRDQRAVVDPRHRRAGGGRRNRADEEAAARFEVRLPDVPEVLGARNVVGVGPEAPEREFV